MARRKKTTKRSRPKAILRLPDLEQSKNAVLNSLVAASSRVLPERPLRPIAGEVRRVCLGIVGDPKCIARQLLQA